MKPEKSLIKNYLYNLSFQIFTMILPLVTVPYISRVLTPEGVGVNAYSLALVSYLILIGGLGFNFYGQKIVSNSRKQLNELKDIFWELITVRNTTLALVIIAYYAYFIISGGNNMQVYLFQGIAIIAAIADMTFFFNGLEQFKKVVSRNFIVKIISLILIFTFVKQNSDINIYIIIVQGATLLGNLLLISNLEPYSIFKNLSLRYFLSLNYKRHIIPSIQLFIPLISIQVYTVFSKLLLGLFTNPIQVGYYENANKITGLCLTILTSFGTVMFPRSNYYFSIGNYTKLKEYFNRAIRITLLVSIGFVFGIIGISNNFVPWFFGKGFESIKYLLPIMAMTIIPISIANVTMTQYLVPTNKNKVYTYSVLCGAFLSIVLNITLVQKFGVVGAIISYVLSEYTVTFVQLFYSREILDSNYLKREIFQEIIAGLVMLVIVVFLDSFLIFNPVIVTIIQVLIGMLIYIGVLIICKNPSLLYILSKFTILVKGHKSN